MDPIEAIEHRVIVATIDNLSEIASSISVPRDRADAGQAHGLDAELLHGGLLERREQPYEGFFRNVISLPRPMRAGQRHAYAISLRIPPGQQMAAHYVHTPLQRSDYFELRVRFGRDRVPPSIWKLDGVPAAVVYNRKPASELLVPDRSGEIHLAFRDLRQGLSYGVSWQAGSPQPSRPVRHHNLTYG